jgi:hypothetical protein
MLCPSCEAVFSLPLVESASGNDWSCYSKEQTTVAQFEKQASQGCYCCKSVLQHLAIRNDLNTLGEDEIQAARTLLFPVSLELRESRSSMHISLRRQRNNEVLAVIIFSLEKLLSKSKFRLLGL